ncbi:MAG: ATP-dependent zinc metalloprotease FtsH [Deltaproteobacteria bacterium]|nr:ATP-dependent zinc metalloprotease FtsH [Deltaproteobacteria bacterium]
MAERNPQDPNDPKRKTGKTGGPEDEEGGDRRGRGFSLLVVGVLGVVLVMQLMGARASAPRVRYDEFKRGVRAGEVEDVQLGAELLRGHLRARPQPVAPATATPDQQIAPGTTPPPPNTRVLQVTRRGPKLWDFETLRVDNDRDLIAMLEQNNVKFEAVEDQRGLVLNLVMIGAMVLGVVLMYRLFARRMQQQQSGVLAFGKSRGRLVGESDIKVRFADVAGVEDAKRELEEIVEFLKRPERFTRLGAKIPKGVLLVGPPGTGKTLLARAVAGEAQVPFFNLSGSEFVEMFVGVGAARVRDLFEQAQQSAPCIVFIDELDALGRSRTGGIPGGSEEREQTLNQLLVEMDGFEANKGVIIMAATNRPEILDVALLRPGRFDRQVLVDPPDRKGRVEILRVHSKGVAMDPEVDLEDIAARTPGFAGADLANIINEGALLAARQDLSAVKRVHLLEAIDRVGIGLEKKSRIIPEQARRRIAYHETGHAIVGEVLPGASKTARISIVPRGMGIGGYVRHMPKEDMHITTEEDLKSRLAWTMGGRAAEKIIFGDLSTGASNDLTQATAIARAMVTEYGMSNRLGPVSYGTRRDVFLPGGEGGSPDYGSSIAEIVDAEVRRLVEEAEIAALTVLESRRDQLESIAKALLLREYLDGDELRALLEAARVPSIAPPSMHPATSPDSTEPTDS